jgi:hypothetical protein
MDHTVTHIEVALNHITLFVASSIGKPVFWAGAVRVKTVALVIGALSSVTSLVTVVVTEVVTWTAWSALLGSVFAVPTVIVAGLK